MDVFLHEYDQNILQVPIYQFIYECFSPSILMNCKVFADKMCSEETGPSK